MLAIIDQIITQAIEQRIFPGAVVLIAQHGAVCHNVAYGSTMYSDAGSQTVTLDTIYDIASLTKVFTATAALRLLDAKQIALDEAAARYLTELRAHTVTLRHLFTHTSGLGLQLSALREHGAHGIRPIVYAAEPVRPPGRYVAYTNSNSLLLGDVVAQVYGKPLDIAIDELVLQPLGMSETGFCPPAALHSRIAPTEWDEEWRGRLVQGSVHDESAYALGGVAGHAGLFSTVADVLRFAQCWLDVGVFARRRLLAAETVELALRDHTGDLEPLVAGQFFRCGLGWMLDRPGFMGNAPRGAYGHTGFTGPVMVLIPQRRLAVIILSNRTYPRRTPPPYPHHTVTAEVVRAVLSGNP
ncbi:MAG: beta-lactamase family protein [Chloroflexales bacterium]|nr:beta-lactamase family protein [Chloroflexales bacterium]